MTCEKLPEDELDAADRILEISDWNENLMIRAGDCAGAIRAVQFCRDATQKAHEQTCGMLDRRTRRIKRLILLLEKWQAYEHKLGTAPLHETFAEIGQAADDDDYLPNEHDQRGA
jgi:hypothetical protein